MCISSDDWKYIIQLTFTVLGGGYALFLFYQSNKEKRNQLVLDIYNGIYNDEDIRKLLYTVDSGDTSEIKFQGELERETDKTLRYFDFIGHLIKDKSLSKKDVAPFKYEIGRILKNNDVIEYIEWLERIGIELKNLKYCPQDGFKPNFNNKA
jgi:hypothetical protein